MDDNFDTDEEHTFFWFRGQERVTEIFPETLYDIREKNHDSRWGTFKFYGYNCDGKILLEKHKPYDFEQKIIAFDINNIYAYKVIIAIII